MKRYTHTKMSVAWDYHITTPNDRMLYSWRPLAIVRELNSLNDRLIKADQTIAHLMDKLRHKNNLVLVTKPTAGM